MVPGQPATGKKTVMPEPAPTPNACRHCGIDYLTHCSRWHASVGRHQWTAPTDAQRLERMRARRRLRLRARAGLIQPDLSEYEEQALNEDPEWLALLAADEQQYKTRILARRAARRRRRRRPAPPPLVSVCPACSICGKETTSEDDTFVCQYCECSWPQDGIDEQPGEWHNPDAPQCPETVQSYQDNTWIKPGDPRKHTAFRCVRDADHTRSKHVDIKEHSHPDMAVFVRGWR